MIEQALRLNDSVMVILVGRILDTTFTHPLTSQVACALWPVHCSMVHYTPYCTALDCSILQYRPQ